MKNSVLSILFLISLVASGCQTSPTGRKQLALVSSGEMDQMGRQGFEDMKKKMQIEKDPATNRYVQCVAKSVTAVLPEKKDWEIVVFKEDTANAFALPGEKIGVHTGLLKVATSSAQLAAVLGHEVGHVLAEHGRARVSEQLVTEGGLTLLNQILGEREGRNYDLLMAGLGLGAQYGILLPHSRAQESEADVIGLDLMAKAGFDPRQSIQLWKNMSASSGGNPPEFLSTHPSHGTRIENLNSHMNEAMKTYKAADRKPDCRL
jgi:predicted Zn-dependent protease